MTLHRDNNATSPSQEQIIGTRFSRYVASSYKQSENGAIIDEQGSNSGMYGIVEMYPMVVKAQ